jgi:hypothetical protein
MAVMVHDGIFVGSGADTYKFAGSVLHCARDPWFGQARTTNTLLWKNGVVDTVVLPKYIGQNAILVGYNEMALNMVDAGDARYFPDDMVNAGLEFITERLAEGDPVLVHCNMGLSRSPSMAFLWMFEHGFLDDEFQYALLQFKSIYLDYCPGNGIFQYLKRRCEQ